MIKLTLAILLVSTVSALPSRNMSMNSDGVYNVGASTVTCTPPYWFLPCTTELWGLLLLVVVYQYLLSLGMKYVSDGSDLFLKTFGPGLIGASLFSFLGTIPQGILIVVSRLSGDTENARAQSAIGMSILAGGAVMNLTLVWGFVVALGSKDFSDTQSSTTSDIEPSSITGSGVTTDVDTSYTARIMMISIVPLLIVQLTNVVQSSTGKHLIVLISLIITLILFASYNLFQIFQPLIENRRFEYLMQKFLKDKLKRLLTSKGQLNTQLIRKTFHEIDRNEDGLISPEELRVFLVGFQLDDDGFIREDYADMAIKLFDTSADSNVDEEEFVNGLRKWLLDAQQTASPLIPKIKPKTDTEEGHILLVQKSNLPNTGDSWKNYMIAAFLIISGIAISCFFAGPLIQSVVAVATATNIPPFLIPYVLVPATMTLRSAGMMIFSARKKTLNSISLTLSQIYGSVFMGNVMGLSMFLIVVYIRDIPVDASAEFLVALVICTVMGVFTSFRTTFPMWTSYLAILLYLISLVTLYVLTVTLGWS